MDSRVSDRQLASQMDARTAGRWVVRLAGRLVSWAGGRVVGRAVGGAPSRRAGYVSWPELVCWLIFVNQPMRTAINIHRSNAYQNSVYKYTMNTYVNR